MASSDAQALPGETCIPVDIKADFQLLNLNSRTCFVTTVPTDGYQGFYGLTWYGMAMIPTRMAFKSEHNGHTESALDSELFKNLQHFSGDLALLRKESNDLLGAMKIDSINGEVQAAKFRANAFVKVLRFVKEIGEDIDGHSQVPLKTFSQPLPPPCSAMWNSGPSRATTSQTGTFTKGPTTSAGGH